MWLICGKLSPTASSSMSRGCMTCSPVHQTLDAGMSAVFETWEPSVYPVLLPQGTRRRPKLFGADGFCSYFQDVIGAQSWVDQAITHLKQAFTFLRDGDQPGTSAGILDSARDWKLLMHLEKPLKLPQNISHHLWSGYHCHVQIFQANHHT